MKELGRLRNLLWNQQIQIHNAWINNVDTRRLNTMLDEQTSLIYEFSNIEILGLSQEDINHAAKEILKNSNTKTFECWSETIQARMKSACAGEC